MRILRAALLLALSTAAPALAQTSSVVAEAYGGRQMLVYAPKRLPPSGSRALVVVLHGGIGNADRIASAQSESGMNLNAMAERYGFVVAYLNGTPVTLMNTTMLGWNAGGGCCGQSAIRNEKDVAYITGAVDALAKAHGIDRRRVYGMGHSNGAMMTQRLMCETDIYASAIAISGPLNTGEKTCPAARGKRLLAIHGADDQNVPITGGRGTQGPSKSVYVAEEESRKAYVASGAQYDLVIVKGAHHMLNDVEAALLQSGGKSIAQTAVDRFGLAAPAP